MLPSPVPHSTGPLLLALFALLFVVGARAGENAFTAHALRGVQRVTIAVEGIPTDGPRYGLTAAELEERAAAQLSAAGLEVIDTATAVREPGASQLRLRLTANLNPYAIYHYALSVRLERKLPLDPSGTSFIAETVWSEGQSGVLNPSDLPRLYAVAAGLTATFLAAHGQQNVGNAAFGAQ